MWRPRTGKGRRLCHGLEPQCAVSGCESAAADAPSFRRYYIRRSERLLANPASQLFAIYPVLPARVYQRCSGRRRGWDIAYVKVARRDLPRLMAKAENAPGLDCISITESR